MHSKKRNIEKIGEIISPALWSIAAIDELDGLADENKRKLIRLRWAFNAIPDLMLVSGERAVLIEAKVESGEDKYKAELRNGTFSASQTEIQRCEISLLMKGLSKDLGQKFNEIVVVMLVKGEKEGALSWSNNVIHHLNSASVDLFTKNCFYNSMALNPRGKGTTAK